MTAKEKIQQHLIDWKKLKTDSQKEEFLAKLQAETDAKNGEELLESMKAIKELVQELHDEVFRPEQIVVAPSSHEEAAFIKALLKKMNVPFKSKNTKASKAVA